MLAMTYSNIWLIERHTHKKKKTYGNAVKSSFYYSYSAIFSLVGGNAQKGWSSRFVCWPREYIFSIINTSMSFHMWYFFFFRKTTKMTARFSLLYNVIIRDTPKYRQKTIYIQFIFCMTMTQTHRLRMIISLLSSQT